MSFRRNSFRKATALLVAFFFHLTLFNSASNAETIEDSTGVSVYYTIADDSDVSPRKEAEIDFDCTDKVFTVIDLSGYPKSKHTLSVKWFNPSGGLQEHTQYSFNVHADQPQRLWAWLLLSRATGAGMVAFINPAAGLEEFIGEWKIEVRIDNKLEHSGTIEVSC